MLQDSGERILKLTVTNESRVTLNANYYSRNLAINVQCEASVAFTPHPVCSFTLHPQPILSYDFLLKPISPQNTIFNLLPPQYHFRNIQNIIK
uniref:Hydrocephalus-inducing protein homolog n=1 Tax=Strongyloides venezuelensis TaxID=75913 RepID=A0A0K0EW02_STRVS